ncbi:MAG: tautomerase family protein [Vibrio sp.]
MPLIQIHTLKKSPEFIDQLSEHIHSTLMETWGIPADDCFQIFHQKEEHELRINPTIFGVNRSKDIILLHITSTPRTKEMKLAFYSQLAKRLNEHLDVRTEDVFISIIENTREDWSFGNGLAQLLDQ